MKHTYLVGTMLVVLATPMVGHAQAQDNPYDTPVVQACTDLMNKVRAQYGRAPMCLPEAMFSGRDTDQYTHMAYLSDDGQSYWFAMHFLPEQVGTGYQYDRSELNQVLQRIQHEGKGITDGQVYKVSEARECAQTRKRLNDYVSQGAITPAQSSSWWADYKKHVHCAN